MVLYDSEADRKKILIPLSNLELWNATFAAQEDIINGFIRRHGKVK